MIDAQGLIAQSIEGRIIERAGDDGMVFDDPEHVLLVKIIGGERTNLGRHQSGDGQERPVSRPMRPAA